MAAEAEPAPAPKAAVEAQPTYSLTLPERWTRRADDGWETITGPDGLVRVRILEAAGADLGEVVEAGWKRASPGMELTERDRSTGPGNERFAEQLVITYTDDGNERFAQGVGLRHAKQPASGLRARTWRCSSRSSK